MSIVNSVRKKAQHTQNDHDNEQEIEQLNACKDVNIRSDSINEINSIKDDIDNYYSDSSISKTNKLLRNKAKIELETPLHDIMDKNMTVNQRRFNPHSCSEYDNDYDDQVATGIHFHNFNNNMKDSDDNDASSSRQFEQSLRGMSTPIPPTMRVENDTCFSVPPAQSFGHGFQTNSWCQESLNLPFLSPMNDENAKLTTSIGRYYTPNELNHNQRLSDDDDKVCINGKPLSFEHFNNNFDSEEEFHCKPDIDLIVSPNTTLKLPRL